MHNLPDASNEAARAKADEYVNSLGAAFHFECYKENKPEGCHQYAEFLSVVRKDPVQSAEVFRNTCTDMRFGESCLALGNMYLTGRGVDEDMSIALSLYEQSCYLGSMGGCNNAGLIAQNGSKPSPENGNQSLQPNGAAAERYFKRSCEGGFKNGCFNLSAMYLKGDLMKQDMPKALEYSLKSCDLGHPYGCGNASLIYRKGADGVEKDTAKGEELLKKAKKLMK